MAGATRQLLRRKLSPEVYRCACYCSWFCRFYLPRRIESLFRRCAPAVEGFPRGNASELADRIRRVNAFAPTRMCRVMSWYGSDKGRYWHNYTTLYSALLSGVRDRPLRILELGLGTNNPALVSTMGEEGSPGASLRGWRKLFPQALVYGADIDRTILFEEDRIKTFYCDQLDRAAIGDLWSQPDLQGGMDLIIDDGLHTFEGNVSFLEGSLEHLRPGGFYIVEDVAAQTLDQWRHYLGSVLPQSFPDHASVLVRLPNAFNDYDNNLVIIRRSGGEQNPRSARS